MFFSSEIELKATLENLPKFIEFVINSSISHHLNSKQLFNIELAIEEALVNLIKHAYKDKEGYAKIAVAFNEEKQDFIIEISDQGKQFNILSKDSPDISSDIIDRPIGGLGIFFIKKFVSSVLYRFEDNKNILTLIIHKEI
ncbi:MAG: ATP-binding protein [Desulfobacterales bacterium]|nr:ATP-binding protein [Desulfobacterales bacterium]